ncbi:MAG: DUF3090 domain-containing protein [Actinomycetota bacterium]|nr:DUF3090 domain-containing protein [Actinomycetota bacterium]
MDLGPVDRITTDAIGEPGFRTFYIQARGGGELVTIVVEKQQVQLLAASILEIMATLDLETGTGPDDSEMDLEQPFEPRFRAGKLSIGYDEERDLFLLEAEELRPQQEEELPDEPDGGFDDDPLAAIEGEGETVRMWARREQMFALSRHGAAVSERGRPTCQFCGNPMDPEGHACPAMNGHSKRT